MQSTQSHTLVTLDAEAMHGHRVLTQAAHDFKPMEMQRRTVQYASSQRSPQSKIVAQGVREVKGGAVTQYIAWWDFADGSHEEFDGMSWTRTKASAVNH